MIAKSLIRADTDQSHSKSIGGKGRAPGEDSSGKGRVFLESRGGKSSVCEQKGASD